jgi:hypothetical protein
MTRTADCKYLAGRLLGVFNFALPGTLALRAVTGSGAIEALASIAGSFAGGALAGPAAYVALHSVFIHAGAASTQ